MERPLVLKIRLAPRELTLILAVVNSVLTDNTDFLTGRHGAWKVLGDDRELFKEESTALRRVRSALERLQRETE